MSKTIMPGKEAAIYLFPSEALDADAIASALLFAELWQIFEQLPSCSAAWASLPHLCKKHSGKQLVCFLPLVEAEELLWRKDIEHILQFIAERMGHGLGYTCEPLETLTQIFEQARCSLRFQTTCPELAPDDAIILLDCHHLPREWSELPQNQQIEQHVIAIWDHRPDSGALAQVPLRCIQEARSCVSLLLRCLQQYCGFSCLSEASCLLSLCAMYLDQQQYGGLLPFEEKIWQALQQRLLGGIGGEPDLGLAGAQNILVQEELGSGSLLLVAEQLQQLQKEVLQQRNEPELSLYQQANSDVKRVLQFAGQRHFCTAVGVVPAPPGDFQLLYENAEFDDFVSTCVKRQNVDFLAILHRQSNRNPRRCISYFFYNKNLSEDNSSLKWKQEYIDFFIAEFRSQFPCKMIYLGASVQGKDELAADGNTQLIQLEQLEQKLSRKAFLPIFQQVMEKLLQHSAA